MSAPLVPSPLDYVGRRPFSFYPAIQNAEPNEWVLGRKSWSELQVLNTVTGRELWIPRQYVGAVSEGDESGLIVGLTKELEYRAGSLGPRVRRVIEISHAARDQAKLSVDQTRRASGPAPVVGIRIEDRAESSMSKAVATLGIGALVLSAVAALLSALARP